MRHATILALTFALLLPAAAIAAESAPTPLVSTAKPAESQAPAKPDMGVSAAPGVGIPTKPVARIMTHLVVDAPLGDDYVMGSKKAPITMIEYASLTCPHCARFSNTTMVDLQKNYIDTGKMRYILRQYPLNEPALKGAMLLECVGKQDKSKYFVFAKVLFDSQDKWAFDGNYMSGLETIATVGGLSKSQFEQCVNNTDREMRVLKVKKDANDELHVPHTPYIIINGEPYEGDRSYAVMSKYLDSKLAGLKK